MKKGHVLLFAILSIALILNVTSVYYSIKVYKIFKEPTLAAHVSSDTADLSLTVEAAPPATCGDASCNGAETCSTCPGDCGTCPSTSPSGGGGGGGGGGGSGIIPRFTVSPEEINIRTVSGESKSQEITLKNTGSETIVVDVGAVVINNYLIFDTNKVILKKGEQKSVVVTINAPEPGVYAGKIKFKSGTVTKEVLVLLNVVSEGTLFDVAITVPEAYKNLYAGESLPTLVELTKVGNAENGVDVTLNYVIKDFDGNVLFTESETLYVIGAKSFNKQFPAGRLGAGDYVVGVELVYPGGFATSSSHFRIEKFTISWLTIIAIILAFISGILVVLAIIFYRKKDKHKVVNKK